MTEARIINDVLVAWGAHPRLRIARINTGKANMARPGQQARWVRFNPKGTADICGLIAPWGRLLMVEVKSATGAQRPEQAAMQRVITAFGGLYVLARSLQDVDRALAQLGITR